jgi:hypothetical protein
MRLWSLHPKYLDTRGLVALWREALLAQEVLRGNTVGYRHHPQLDRFRAHSAPLSAISLYLEAVYAEALTRGYAFNRGKFRSNRKRVVIPVSAGQLRYEWKHLRTKLRRRNPMTWRKWARLPTPHAHPLFRVREGPVEPWERGSGHSSVSAAKELAALPGKTGPTRRRG